jgi:hypothetical protein
MAIRAVGSCRHLLAASAKMQGMNTARHRAKFLMPLLSAASARADDEVFLQSPLWRLRLK